MKLKSRLIIGAFLLVVFCCLSLNIAKSQSLIELVPCALNSSQTETLVTRIDVGEQPLHLAINPTAKKIYVTNFVDDTVSVIDSETNTVLKTISVGAGPNGISLSSKKNKIYVANQLDSTVSVIDGSTDSVISAVSVGQKPVYVSFNENTNEIYVSNQDSNTVSVIDANSDLVTSEITVGSKPQGIGINTKTNKIYVANTESDSISVIDGSSDTVIKTLENLITNPSGIAIDEGKNIAYAFALSGDELLGRGVLYVIDGSTDTVLQGIIIGSNGSDIVFHKASDKVYITHTFNSTIDGYNTKKDELLCIITEIFDPAGIAIDPNTNLIYVCESFTAKVAVIQDTGIKKGDDKNDKPEKPQNDEPSVVEIDPELINDFNQAVEGLTSIRNEIKASSKFGRPVASRIASVIRKLMKITSFSQPACENQVRVIVEKLEAIIPFFESKSCSEVKTRRCIPLEIADELLAQYEEQIELIRALIETDDNGDDISDLCER